MREDDRSLRTVPPEAAGIGDRLGRIDRRQFLTATGAGIAMATGVGSCAATPVVATAFNPAVQGWLGSLATMIAADVIGDIINDRIDGRWKSWTKATSQAVSEEDFEWHGTVSHGHPVPPTILIRTSKAKKGDPMTDRLLACVDKGRASVVFEAWAWQALSMFVQQLLRGKEGADRAGFQSLAVLSLIPSGTKPSTGNSPRGSVGWMTYETRNGSVEIAKVKKSGGSHIAIITAEGIPDKNHNPTVKEFTLPAVAA